MLSQQPSLQPSDQVLATSLGNCAFFLKRGFGLQGHATLRCVSSFSGDHRQATTGKRTLHQHLQHTHSLTKHPLLGGDACAHFYEFITSAARCLAHSLC
jgi:hypothetical protein